MNTTTTLTQGVWCKQNPDDVEAFEKQMRRKVHYVIEPQYLWSNIAEQARTQDDELLHTLQQGFKYIENHSFDTSFQGLFSEINLDSEKLGKKYAERNKKLCTIIHKIAEGIARAHRKDHRYLPIPQGRKTLRRAREHGGN